MQISFGFVDGFK